VHSRIPSGSFAILGVEAYAVALRMHKSRMEETTSAQEIPSNIIVTIAITTAAAAAASVGVVCSAKPPR
jgi:hypothetical protein